MESLCIISPNSLYLNITTRCITFLSMEMQMIWKQEQVHSPKLQRAVKRSTNRCLHIRPIFNRPVSWIKLMRMKVFNPTGSISQATLWLNRNHLTNINNTDRVLLSYRKFMVAHTHIPPLQIWISSNSNHRQEVFQVSMLLALSEKIVHPPQS
jgi:hypothetical protein